jgi:regulator of protease activity HflC (stomatin/prohibitin superfamily)
VVGRTSDGQTVNVDITILYRIPPATSGQLYQDWNENYLDAFVRPTTRAISREVISRYTAEQIYGEAREQLANDIKYVLEVRFTEENLELSDLLIRNINFSEEFTQAIEQKVVAEQNLERARTEAQRVEAEAQGQARAALARAEGEANAIEVRAQAEAEALRLVSQQIASNPSLIQYLYVQNLSDNVNIALVPANSPFLFDVASLANPDSGFTAPTVPQGRDNIGQPTEEPPATPQPGN